MKKIWVTDSGIVHHRKPEMEATEYVEVTDQGLLERTAMRLAYENDKLRSQKTGDFLTRGQDDVSEALDEFQPHDPFPILPKTDGREHSQSTVIILGQWFLRNYYLVERALQPTYWIPLPAPTENSIDWEGLDKIRKTATGKTLDQLNAWSYTNDTRKAGDNAPTDPSKFKYDRSDYVVMPPIRKNEDGILTDAPTEKVDVEEVKKDTLLCNGFCGVSGDVGNGDIMRIISDTVDYLAARFDFVPKDK